MPGDTSSSDGIEEEDAASTQAPADDSREDSPTSETSATPAADVGPELRAAARRAIATSIELRGRLDSSRAPASLPTEIREVPEGLDRDEEILALIPDGYLVTDENGIISSANRAAVLLLSVPASHLVGKPIFNFIAMEDRFILRRVLLALRQDSNTKNNSEFVRITPRHRAPFDASLRFTGIRDSHTKQLIGARWLLRDMTERSRAETERYRLLVNAVEDYAILLLDENAHIIGWNRGAEMMFGYSETEAQRLPYATLFPPDQQEMSARETAEARATGSFREEGWMVRKNGERFFGQGVLLALPSMGTGRAGYAKILRDRTEAQKQEEALPLSEARLQIALKAAGAGTWDWDLRTNEVNWSDDYWMLLGLDREHDVPSYDSWKKSIPPEDQEEAIRRVQEAIDTGCDLVNEHSVVTPPGTPKRWLLSLGKALQNNAGNSYRLTGITMDISERKIFEQELAESRLLLEQRVRERTKELTQANALLHAEMEERQRLETARQQLVQQVVRAQEAERQRISRELHDHMGQHLTAFALGLKALEDTYTSDADAKQKLTHLRQITESLGGDLHRLAVELRPTSLNDLGLIRALRGYVENWMERTGVKVDFEVSGVAEKERLPDEMETALYRIAQESLTNAAKYSDASRVSIVLTRQPAQITFIVEDNGRGFDSTNETTLNNSPKARPRLGLAGMRERATLLGGSLTIESAPGNGTTIFVRLPLPDSSE